MCSCNSSFAGCFDFPQAAKCFLHSHRLAENDAFFFFCHVRAHVYFAVPNMVGTGCMQEKTCLPCCSPEEDSNMTPFQPARGSIHKGRGKLPAELDLEGKWAKWRDNINHFTSRIPERGQQRCCGFMTSLLFLGTRVPELIHHMQNQHCRFLLQLLFRNQQDFLLRWWWWGGWSG